MKTRAPDRTLAFAARLWPLLLFCALPISRADAQVLRGHEGLVACIAFSPDGKALLARVDGKETAVWDVARRKQKARFRSATESMALAVSPDGKSFVTADDEHTVLLRVIKTGKQKVAFSGHTEPVKQAVFSRDGKVLVTASSDGTIRVWDAATGKARTTIEEPIHSMAASQDGKRIATAGLDRTVRLWNSGTGKELRSITPDSRAYALAYSPDGKVLAAGSDGVVLLLDATSLKLLKTLKVGPDAGYVFAVTFSPDGKTLAATGPDKGRGVRLWRVADVLPKPAKPGAKK